MGVTADWKIRMKAEKSDIPLTAKSAMQTIALIIAVAAAFLLARYFKAAELAKDPEFLLSSLEEEAAELNATLPEMVSEGVRLDAVTSGPGNAFNYSYTIVDEDAARNMAGNANRLSDLRTQLQERVCATMPDRRANNTIVKYTLRDAKGATIADIAINAGDCP